LEVKRPQLESRPWTRGAKMGKEEQLSSGESRVVFREATNSPKQKVRCAAVEVPNHL
jgi:hypothetical protein